MITKIFIANKKSQRNQVII